MIFGYSFVCYRVRHFFEMGAVGAVLRFFLRRKMPFSSFFSALFCRKKSRFGHVKQG